MSITGVLAISAAVTGCAWPDAGVSSAPRPSDVRLVVCMTLGSDVPDFTAAEKMAQKMFAEIGVRTEWPQRGDACAKGGDIVITLSYQTPASKLPGAFAYALPYEGAHIVVFWDRVQRKVPPAVAPMLLAHVLVHEITHILQGTSRHSETGLMKAAWSSDDLYQMRKKPLKFTEEDLLLIHRGIAKRSLATLSIGK